MKTTADFLDALHIRFGVRADNGLTSHTGWQRQQITRYRTCKSTFDDETALKVARWLEIDPSYVNACMAAQRAKSEESRRQWEKVAKRLATSAGALLVALGLGALPRPTEAAEFDSTRFTARAVERPTAGRFTHYARIMWRRLATIAYALRSTLGRTLGSIPGRAALGAP